MELLYDPDAIYGHASTQQPQKPREFKIFGYLSQQYGFRNRQQLNGNLIQYKFSMITKFTGFYVPQRYLLTFMGFMGLVMAYSMRLSLSVAITQMVPPPIVNMANLTTTNGEIEIICPYSDENYIHEHFDYQAIFDQLYSVILQYNLHKLSNY